MMARANRITQAEARWLKIIHDAELGNERPFRAAEAQSIIIEYRAKNWRGLRHIPNKYRLNYVLKKSGDFVCMKDSGNRNHWKLRRKPGGQ